MAHTMPQTSGPIVSDPITVTSQAGDDDGNATLATEIGGGSKMTTSVPDTPASASVITAREIRDRGAETVEQILRYILGVVTNFHCAGDRFDNFKIRGFDTYAHRDGLTLGRPFGTIRKKAYA